MSSNEDFHYWQLVDKLREERGREQMEKANQRYFLTAADFDAWASAPKPVTMSVSDLTAAAREEGAKAERERIAQKLAALKPTETQYTRIQWRWEEKGAQAMYDKVMKAISQP